MVYVALLRGINVGGKNKVPMAGLRRCFEELGLQNVRTYIASGNVIFETDKDPKALADKIEKILPRKFNLNRDAIRVLIISRDQLRNIVSHAPPGFGEHSDKYYSDTVFLINETADKAMEQIETHTEVDWAWPGDGVIYFQRLGAKRTKSRLPKLVGKPIYQNMTIRSWNTTIKLLHLTGNVKSGTHS